jgi:hypothetical protein
LRRDVARFGVVALHEEASVKVRPAGVPFRVRVVPDRFAAGESEPVRATEPQPETSANGNGKDKKAGGSP